MKKENNKRRDFIKQLGLLSAGTGILSATPTLINAQNSKEEFSVNEESLRDGKKSTKTRLNILQTTDVHCQIHPHDELFWENGKSTFRRTGGYAELSTFFKTQKKKNPNTFIVDTGDMFQGSELSVKTTGKAISPILNELGYNLYLPGNWEVIYYKKAMQTLLGSLNAPKVCANMYHDMGNGKRGELIFHPYQIWNVAGIKIGFLGYTDPLVPLRQSPNYSKGIIYTKPEENLEHYVKVLKEDEQCAYIILLSHLGLSQQIALANSVECKGVDIIFGGDTHERVRKPIQCKYSKVVEPGAFGSFVGQLQLEIENGKVVNEYYSLIEVKSDELKPDPKMLQLIAENEGPWKASISEIIGYSTIPLFRYFVVENPIDTLILEALKWQVKEADIVLSNGFRFCPPRTTADHTGKIPITNGFLFDMLPVDSTVRTADVTGKQLQEWMEKELNNVFAKDASKRFGGWVIKFKGMTMKFKAFEEMGKRVQELLVNGLPIDPEKTYKICACERDGDPEDMLCRIKGVKNGTNTPYTLHSTMKAYLKNNSPVTPTPPKSCVILDASQELLSQVFGVDYEFR